MSRTLQCSTNQLNSLYSILAIDAAWTSTEPTGVSLLQKNADQWHSIALAPSYADFYGLANGQQIDWDKKPQGEIPDIEQLLSAATRLLGNHPVTLITVDMPISTIPILGRRQAERAISRAYGAMGCAAHSPSVQRPGNISTIYTEGCCRQGYSLGVTTTSTGQVNTLLEVYPHPALIRLMGADYRLPYKAAKSSKYWPDDSATERKSRLVKLYYDILVALSQHIHDISLNLPADLIDRPFSHFKRFEDAIDALVCGWVGMKYLDGEATAFGDETGAIWVPK